MKLVDMSDAEKSMRNIVSAIGAKYFINSKLGVCSRSLRRLVRRCTEETLPLNETNNARFRELNDSIEPAGIFRYHYLRIVRGYKPI